MAALFRHLFRDRHEPEGEERWLVPSVSTLGWMGAPTISGVSVTPEVALTNAAVAGARRILVSTVANMPIDVVRVQGERRIEVATPPIVADPSVWTTQRGVITQSVTSGILRGNAYWMVDSTATGFETVEPLKVRWDDSDGRLRVYVDNVEEQLWPVGRLVHIPASPWLRAGWPAADSPVDLARETVGTALAAAGYGAGFFGSHAQPEEVWKSDNYLTGTEAEEYQKVFHESRRSRLPTVIGSGWERETRTVDPDKTQYIDLMRFITEEVARFIGVPTNMLYATVSGQQLTYQNITQDDLRYLKYSLQSWVLDLETAWSSLLPRGQEVKFRVDSLLRMDAEGRNKIYDVQLKNGTLTTNEQRAMEDRRPFTAADYEAENPADRPGLAVQEPETEPEPEPENDDEGALVP